MARRDRVEQPKNYFLNEAHELASLAEEGGGRHATYVGLDWPTHAMRLSATFSDSVTVDQDPGQRNHVFMLAKPAQLTKHSTAKTAPADGRVPFSPRFGGKQAPVLGKLGFDLIGVNADGVAMVHVERSKLPRVQNEVENLGNARRTAQNRWVNIGEFDSITNVDRLDEQWLSRHGPDELVRAHLRLLPLLSRFEADEVLEALRAALSPDDRLIRRRRDFSGRHGCIAVLSPCTIRSIVRQFPSLQSVHPLLASRVAPPCQAE